MVLCNVALIFAVSWCGGVRCGGLCCVVLCCVVLCCDVL